MLSPFLLVGVGGSGGKTLRVVRADLERRLAQAGWSRDFPSAWQFLHIDVPTTADGNEPDLPDQLPEAFYQGLIGSGIDYRTVDDSLVQQAAGNATDALGGWRPDPDRVNVPASKGAGQYRALGRTITLSQLRRINNAIREARRQLTGADVTTELKDLTRLLGSKDRTIAPDPQVIVVASIAGGSGSGAILDVCDVIRSLGDKWANESVGILYCPDVFDDLDEGLRRGVRPNSLAALAEIMSGYWSTDGPSASTSELFQSAGISTGSSRRLGPRFPFLVGAKNESVTHKTQNDVYQAMGRSLAAWVTSPTLQDRMAAYTQATWPATAQAVTDSLRLHPSGTETPFSALGSARVGLGRDRFREYSSQHLARGVVDLVLEKHETLRGRGDERPSQQLVHEQAAQALGSYVREAGLAELGPGANDIIDALQNPTALQARVDAVGRRVLSRVNEARGVKGFTTDDLRRTIRNEVVAHRDSVGREARAERLERARAWVEQIQGTVRDATAAAISRHGGRVAAVLVRRLITEMAEAREELRHEAERDQKWAADIDRLIGLDNVRNATEDEVEHAVMNAVRALELEQEAEVRELAVRLIPHLIAGLLEPLAEAVEHGVEGLATEVSGGRDGRGSVASSWPTGDIVPKALRPAPNEFLLQSFQEFPAILQDLVQRSVGETSAGDARSIAERQVLLGGHGAPGAQTLLGQDRSWVPPLDEIFGGRSPSNAHLVLAVGSGELLTRAEGWAVNTETAIGRYLKEGLRAYLDADATSPKIHAERVKRFENQLIAAIRAGAPLVSVNTAVLTRTHNTELKYSVQFSEIPLPERTAAREALVTTLEARKLYGPSVEQAFSDSEAQFIDIFTVLAEPYEPVVFDSLMRPIMSDWGAKKATPVDREEFWRWRRARPLPEALPLHPTTLQSMVRGWFVAGVLEQVQNDPLAVYTLANAHHPAGFVPFESPLLSGTGRGAEALPDLLESISVALLRVNDEESLEPMRPYHRLLDLGEGASNDLPLELRRWIEDGRRAHTAVVDPGTPAQRQAAAVEKVTEVSKRFDRHFTTLEARHDSLGYPGSYDLRHQIRSALGDLFRALTSYTPSDEDSFV